MIFLSISCFFASNIFKPIFIANEIIIPYGITPFDICQENPILWNYIKIFFIIFYLFANFVLIDFIYNLFFNRFIFKKKCPKNKKLINKKNNNYLNLLIGENKNKEKIYIPESGLFQNILITRNNRFWKNKFCHVPLYKTIFRI